MHFWNRIPSLRVKSKCQAWRYAALAVPSDTPCGQWPLGRALEVFRSKDQHVQSLKLQVEDKTIHKAYYKG